MDDSTAPTLPAANGDTRLALWQRVREYAVPPSMIDSATARRQAGDWGGACAAARVDVDLRLRDVARRHGHELAARVRDDLRHLAPDLLRWHMPRVAPDGLLRPGLTATLARYVTDDTVLQLVVRTPPAWAAGGQHMSIALRDGTTDWRAHPHPRPRERFRLDLHRHLWDARRSGELRARADALTDVDLWAAEARLLLAALGRTAGRVEVRPGTHGVPIVSGGEGPSHSGVSADTGNDPTTHLAPRGAVPAAGQFPAGIALLRVGRRVFLDVGSGVRDDPAPPVLPDAATHLPPDVDLLRAGLITPGRLHPLVADALAPGWVAPDVPEPADRGAHLVECRGAVHRIGTADGVLSALDHDPAELAREELLVALGGPPLPCLQAIDDVHRRPDCLDGVREGLDHGDTARALAIVEGLLGPEAVLRDGPLRDALTYAAGRRIAYGFFRAGLERASVGGRFVPPKRRAATRSHPRNADQRS